MIKCIIVDDEPLAQEILENFVRRVPQLELVKKCGNALEAFQVLTTLQLDLMFLDIKMPAISGIDLIRSLKNPPAVIFTTAFADYALTGFELEAIDYLLKPITFERFEKSIFKLLKIYLPNPVEVKNYSYFKVSGQLIKIIHSNLLYAQSLKDYILLCTSYGNHVTYMTMKHLADLLPPEQFVRVHRSYLINKGHVERIDRNTIEIANKSIPIGESYRKMAEDIKW